METSDILRDQIFSIIENQMRDNDPSETNFTFNRLTKLGFSDIESKQLIGQCLSVELFDVIKNYKPFDENRYVNNLKNLPDEPFD